jgi:hypothetical protein
VGNHPTRPLHANRVFGRMAVGTFKVNAVRTCFDGAEGGR